MIALNPGGRAWPGTRPEAPSESLVEVRVRARHAGCIAKLLPPDVKLVQVGADARGGAFSLRAADEAERMLVVERLRETVMGGVRVLAASGGSALLRVRGALPCPLSQRLRDDHVVLWPVVYENGEESYRLLAPSADAVRTLVADVGADAEVALDAASHVPVEAVALALPVAGAAAGLTRRQLDVIQAAIRAGYYEMPRRVGTQDLARTFGVGRTTFEEHLRKAERVVLSRFGDLLASHAALALAARKTRGRPPTI